MAVRTWAAGFADYPQLEIQGFGVGENVITGRGGPDYSVDRLSTGVNPHLSPPTDDKEMK